MYLGQTEEQLEEMQLNPTVWEVGFPPVRVTVPVTSERRQKEIVKISVGMVVASAALLYLGGGYLKQVIEIWRGQ